MEKFYNGWLAIPARIRFWFMILGVLLLIAVSNDVSVGVGNAPKSESLVIIAVLSGLWAIYPWIVGVKEPHK